MPDDDTATVATEPVDGQLTPEIRRTRAAERQEAHARRRREVMSLRRSGLTFQEIGDTLGISPQGANKLWKASLKGMYRKDTEEERELLLIRCDGIIRRWWPRMMTGEHEEASTATIHVMRAMSVQMEMWGFKRPNVELNVTGVNVMPSDVEVWQHLEAFRQEAAGPPPTGYVEATATLESGVDTTPSPAPVETNGHHP